MANVDVEKLICSLLNPSKEMREKIAEEKHVLLKQSGETFVSMRFIKSLLRHSLEEQDLEFVDGKLVNKE